MKNTLFDFINDVSHLKKGILNDENESELSIYMLNRFLSMDPTTILYANEMNMNYHLSKKMQYDYYLHSIKKQKRFFKYIKHKNQDEIELIREYFGYNESLAKQILPILDPEQIEYIKTKLNKGGSSNAKQKAK